VNQGGYGACSSNEETRNIYRIITWNPLKSSHLEDNQRDKKILLKLILGKQFVRIPTVLNGSESCTMSSFGIRAVVSSISDGSSPHQQIAMK
jgi:hypothetical protein